MNRQLLNQAQPKMQRAFDFLSEELKTIRSGRAMPSLIDGLTIEVYGQPMQLKQLASITTPDAKSIMVSPWDISNLAAIEKAIVENKELGLNPVNDGKALHINVPPLTSETRESMIKQVGDKVEHCYISLRSTRHEVLNEAKQLQKEGQISEDDYHRLDKQLSEQIDNYRQRIEELADNKRQELREI